MALGRECGMPVLACPLSERVESVSNIGKPGSVRINRKGGKILIVCSSADKKRGKPGRVWVNGNGGEILIIFVY